MIELKHVSKTFDSGTAGGVDALKDVSLTIEDGDIYGIIGMSGAGKSTLVRCINLLEKPDSGAVLFHGEDMTKLSPRSLRQRRRKISMIFQSFNLLDQRTALDNICFPMELAGVSRKEARVRAARLLDTVGLPDKADAYPVQLSGGQKQRIAIARALASDPEVLLCDEATSALTENRVKWLLALARRLANEGKIVIFISHRMSEIQDGCDNISILRNGTYAGDVKVDENLDMDQVIAMMLGRKMSGYFPEIVDHTEKDVMLDVKDLRYNRALNGVDLQLYRGEVLGVGGLAGQGQAELLLSLFGVHQAKGEVALNGKPVVMKDPRSALRQGIALVPEERGVQGLFLAKSIGYNISLPSIDMLTKGIFISPEKENAIIKQYMETLAVKANGPETPVQDLSGGNQQKVLMAKIMSCKPELLLLHDITRGVDVGTKKEMFGLVRDFVKDGRAVIFFSTDVEELVHVCDRVVVMHDGRIGADLKGAALTKENIIGASIGMQAQAGA